MSPERTSSSFPSSKPVLRQMKVVGIATILAVGGTLAFILSNSKPSQTKQQPESTRSPAASLPQIKTITALGHLEPAGEVIQLSAPTSSEGNRIEQLLVREGDRVRAGQVIAILDSRDRLAAALAEAEERLRVDLANLTRVKAGAKTGEIEAQRATIARIAAERNKEREAQAAAVARLEAQLQNARTEDQRYQNLYRSGAISASIRDSKSLELETAQKLLQEGKANLERIRSAQEQELREARANLTRIAEVRDVDVAVAIAESNAARAALNRARAELDKAYVKAPQDGQILEIHSLPGELVGDRGIVDIGHTKEMYAIAEVYESDIAKVTPGQQAEISSDSLSEKLQGTVESIGLQVRRQNVINSDPSANIDGRVVEVKVRLNEASSQKVAGLTNLQVKVAIEI